jgi:hypothetical protein
MVHTRRPVIAIVRQITNLTYLPRDSGPVSALNVVALGKLYAERRYTMHTRLSLPMHATANPGSCMSEDANLCATLESGQTLRLVILDSTPFESLI